MARTLRATSLWKACAVLAFLALTVASAEASRYHKYGRTYYYPREVAKGEVSTSEPTTKAATVTMTKAAPVTMTKAAPETMTKAAPETMTKAAPVTMTTAASEPMAEATPDASVQDNSTTSSPEPMMEESPEAIATSAPPSEGDRSPRKPSWRDHPLYRAHPDSITPPILAWYTTRNNEESPKTVYAMGRYTQRGCRLNILTSDVEGKPEAKRLYNYDVLALGTWGAAGIDNFLEFETTREAQVCLVFGVDDPGFKGEPDVKMSVPPGYTSVGLAQWDKASPAPKSHNFSSFRGEPIEWSYVACRKLPAGVHQMPSVDKMQTQYKLWGYNLLFSEADGSAPELTALPPGWAGPEIKQHERCPEELHKMWVIESHDKSDPQISGKMWQTWHPQKDQLYGCYYGHEHGSPGMLAGYEERYHYVSLKNNDQDEDHEGFKGYVVPVGDKYVYVNIHAETKKLSRVNVQFHTMVIAITDQKSGNLLYEMSCKADFGGSGADYAEGSRPKDGPDMLPMGNAATQKLLEETYLSSDRYFDRKIVKKRINLYNPGNLDPRLRYEKGDKGRGVYEGWTGGGEQFCMNSSQKYRSDGIEIDIKNAHTGCVDQDCTREIILGNAPDKYRSYFFPNLGTNREIIFRGTSIGPEHCQFKLPKVGADGIFYTDQYCQKTCDGPGPNCVRQIMKPEFKGFSANDAYSISDVHGHNMYEVSRPGGPDDFENEVEGLHGYEQYEGALGIDLKQPE